MHDADTAVPANGSDAAASKMTRITRQFGWRAATIAASVLLMPMVIAKVLNVSIDTAMNAGGNPFDAMLHTFETNNPMGDSDGVVRATALRSACIRASDPEGRWTQEMRRLDAYAPVFYKMEISDDRIRAGHERGTDYLACTMETDVARFCEPFWRKQLASHLRSHVEVHAKTYKALRQSLNGDKLFSGIADSDVQDRQSAIDGGVGISAGVIDPRIARALDSLTSAGLVTLKDLQRIDPVLAKTLTSFMDATRPSVCAP